MRFRRRESRAAVITSVAMHGAVVCLLVVGGTRARVLHRMTPASRCCVAVLQIAGGSHAVPLPIPEKLSTGQSHKAYEKSEVTRTADPTRRARAMKAAPPAPLQSAGTGTGTAADGSGSDSQNVTPAFPVFSPKPPVTDRSLLPASEMQVVVDVQVSADGNVLGETLVKGLGNAIDALVLETVKTWRFHPAMVNGKPVASEAECIFPFNMNYPITRG